jgi:succinate-acetate transporter protein
MTFLLLAAGEFTNKVGVTKAGGALGTLYMLLGDLLLSNDTSGTGICAALAAYYGAFSHLMIRDESWFGVPMGNVVRKHT